jgi:hypothetical protein
MSDAVLAPVRGTFRALAQTFVPESEALDGPGWSAAEAIVEQALAERPAGVRRQVGLLIRVLEVLPLLRWGRRFSALDAPTRLRFLQALQGSPVLLLRRGIWGLRTLALMGYYARPEAATLIGYRADARGWDARR